MSLDPLTLTLPPHAVVLLIGAPGAGKTTFCHRYFKPETIVSLDRLRWAVSGDEGDQSATRDAVRIQGILLRSRISRGLTTVVDATNLEFTVRRRIRKLALQRKRPVIVYLFQESEDVCQARNAGRPRRVEPGILAMLHRKTPTAGQLAVEGFGDIRPIPPGALELTEPGPGAGPGDSLSDGNRA
ncbi:AAA family ATPase [Streptomyces xiamenensis]|uniref:AAA family ATPase n=1 Tax=Streptomyces xiamenensis TaxID=408015 RepID=UPI0035DC40DB